jgi:hypothetical protein
MMQDRLARSRARGLRRDRLGHVGDPVHRSWPAEGGRPRRVLDGRVRRDVQLFTILSKRFGIETTFVPHRSSRPGAAIRPNTRLFFVETPSNPLTEISPTSRAVARSRMSAARCSRWTTASARRRCSAARARRRHRHPFGHQVPRRAGQGARRGRGRPERADHGRGVSLPAHRRPVALAVQRLGHPEGAGDAAYPHGGAVGAAR